MIAAIWDSVLNCVSEWEESTKKGKILLENKRPGIESCISQMVIHI